MSVKIEQPYPIFRDKIGLSLDGGLIYIGVAGLNPETNPIQCYFDDDFTLVAPQPLRTINGYISRNGSPANIFLKVAECSITIKDRFRITQYTNLNFELSNFGKITSDQVIDGSGKNQSEINIFVKDKTISFLDFGCIGDGVTDDSIGVASASAWSSLYNRPVTGLGKTYACNNVLFDSNCHLRDANLINNKHDTDLISVLTTDVNRDWLENVTFENIHINGNRILATGVKTQSLAEDGGRHGFRFRRPCRNINMINCSANYCASDGVIVFPDLFDGGVVPSVFDFNIENCEFSWNRRHGGSSDRTNGMNWINTICNNNGRYLEGHQSDSSTSGAQGDRVNNNTTYYGNGWDVEEYDNSQMSSNLNFINCEMIDNAKGGLLVLGYTQPTAVSSNIKVKGGRYNKGVLNTSDNVSITVTPNGFLNTNSVFENVVIESASTTDAILLRNVNNYCVMNTPCILTAVEYATGFYDSFVTLVNSATSSKNYLTFAPNGDKYKYNRAFDIIQATNLKVTTFDTTTAGINHQQQYLYNGVLKGSIIHNIKPSDTTVSIQYVVNNSFDTMRIESTGVTMNNSSSLIPANIGEMTLTPISNTQISLKYKGSDGVVRSANLTLS